MAAMGKYRGGPAKVAVLASSFFGTISGSAVAGADGKVDLTFSGNAVSESDVTVSVAGTYVFDTISYSGQGSGYHVSENGSSLVKPVITVAKSSSTHQVDATVAANGTLSFCWRLVMAPETVPDYVVAHEVAHLAERGHGPRFWSAVDELTSDSEGARAWLRDNGDRLHRYG